MSMFKKWDDLITSYLDNDTSLLLYRNVLIEMKAEGISSEEAYSFFGNIRKKMVEEGNEKKEEIILEVMDIITGFCGSHLYVW